MCSTSLLYMMYYYLPSHSRRIHKSYYFAFFFFYITFFPVEIDFRIWQWRIQRLMRSVVYIYIYIYTFTHWFFVFKLDFAFLVHRSVLYNNIITYYIVNTVFAVIVIIYDLTTCARCSVHHRKDREPDKNNNTNK